MTDKQTIDDQLHELSSRTGRLVFGILWTPERPFLVVESTPDEAATLVEP